MPINLSVHNASAWYFGIIPHRGTTISINSHVMSDQQSHQTMTERHECAQYVYHQIPATCHMHTEIRRCSRAYV